MRETVALREPAARSRDWAPAFLSLFGLSRRPQRWDQVLREIAGGYRLLLTRDLDAAKEYLRDRYSDAPEARYGLVASSKDRDLAGLGIPNDWNGTKLMNLNPGPWFCEGGEHPRSCLRLAEVATEFQAQGLELDAALLAWGTDLVRRDGVWSNANARSYKRGAKVRDPFQLRINAYRVLLTRARDVSVVYVPPLAALDETHRFLGDCGAREFRTG